VKSLRIFILLITILGASYATRAGIRPSFMTHARSLRAIDTILVTGGDQIDGASMVLEILNGDLKSGQPINVPHVAEFRSKEARLVSEPWYQTSKSPVPFYVTGNRMILFLIDAEKAGMSHDEEDDNEGESNSNPNTSRWRSANPMGNEVKYSTVWIEKGEVYSFIQLENPGPSLLHKFSKSERAFRDDVTEVVSLRNSFDSAITNPSVSARAESLEPFVHASADPARAAAFKQLIKCGKAALPVLRRMLEDDSLDEIHSDVIEALGKAGGKTAGPDLTQVVAKELSFWKGVAPSLKPGWWNGVGFDSIEAVEAYRHRYMNVYNALEALKVIRYRDSAEVVTQLREYWRSTPQLFAGLDQIGEDKTAAKKGLPKNRLLESRRIFY